MTFKPYCDQCHTWHTEQEGHIQNIEEVKQTEREHQLREAIKPFLEVEAATHAGEWSPELEDDDYISVYHHDIRVKHFRALKKAVKGFIP